jgi:LDH2 family malate/lactate/ureidoglycolate dehydrogenase
MKTTKDIQYYTQSQLQNMIQSLFVAAGVGQSDASIIAHMMVLQEMRGITTHGLRRVHSNLDGLHRSWINAMPLRKLITDRGAIAVIDGDNGIGMLGCTHAMQLAIERARTFGIGMVSVINSNHFLSAAPYGLMAVEAGMIGLVFSNTQASMGYPGTQGNQVGNNPLGYAMPTDLGFPVVFDTSLTTSMGQLDKLKREGGILPKYLPGLDANGNLTTDPHAITDGGTALPIGYHKGAGLGLMVEMLTGLLAGGIFLKDLLPINQRKHDQDGETQTCIAINIEHFMPVSAFKHRAGQMVCMLHEQSSDPNQPAKLPGERAHACYQHALEHGIPVPVDVIAELDRWAEQLNVSLHEYHQENEHD